MLFSEGNPITRFRRRHRLKKIAAQVRAGNVPKGVSEEDIFEALRITRPLGALEMFGILCARHIRGGQVIQDLGVVGVKKVTLEFAELLVDAMCSSGASDLLPMFGVHAMGDGSTPEASGDEALVSMGDEDGSRGTMTHGATSNIYESVKTITATSTYTVIEHGIFDTTGASDLLLDRTIVGTPFTVATDDEVEWTYRLTVNTET